MPDFRENGVIICARLESKKSASGAVKKFRAAEWSRKMSRGGWFNPPPPPGRFRVKYQFTWNSSRNKSVCVSLQEHWVCDPWKAKKMENGDIYARGSQVSHWCGTWCGNYFTYNKTYNSQYRYYNFKQLDLPCSACRIKYCSFGTLEKPSTN